MSPSKRALVVLLVVSQGCYIDFKGPGRPRVVAGSPGWRQTTKPAKKALGGDFGPKIVEYKKPPTRLISRDGTSCTVSDKKFHATNLGASVWCTWYDTDAK